MQGKGSRHIEHLIHLCPCRLGHSSPGIGGQRVQITAGALGVQDAQGKGGFSGAGHAGNGDDLVEGNLDIDIFQVMDLCAADQDVIDHSGLPSGKPSIPKSSW